MERPTGMSVRLRGPGGDPQPGPTLPGGEDVRKSIDGGDWQFLERKLMIDPVIDDGSWWFLVIYGIFRVVIRGDLWWFMMALDL